MGHNPRRSAFVIVAESGKLILSAVAHRPRRHGGSLRSYGVLRQVLWLLFTGHHHRRWGMWLLSQGTTFILKASVES